MRSTRGFLLTILAVCAGSAVALHAENWPQWRGPVSQGISTETAVPMEWAPDKNILWKTELPGRGHSSPVVWGDRIFLTTAVEGDIVPGAKAVEHTVGGQKFVHPDSEEGDTFLLKAGASPEVVRTNKLDEPVYTSPAIANGRIYIRGEKHLFAIGT